MLITCKTIVNLLHQLDLKQITMTIPILDYTILPIGLTLKFSLDNLSLIMLCFVGFIGSMVLLFAWRYMKHDIHRYRFHFQLVCLIFSVFLLVLSGNLLTAFIAWQLIGASLYVLLNHYHYHPIANKSAKKKFIINRIGDLCFLTAVVLCIATYQSTDFSLLAAPSSTNATILGLIFIAVMTKSAQFPFHIWLIDTMEAPTPVSAIMHAGVINAGGFLLTRLGSYYLEFTSLMLIIFCIGITTALLGQLLAQYENDTKKRLAYSTMGQMGFMILQCGLGAFSSAIFHLIAHGFYKAYLFFNAGSTLNKTTYAKTPNKILLPLIMTALIVFVAFFASTQLAIKTIDSPILVVFIAITLFTILRSGASCLKSLCILSLVSFVILFVYLMAIGGLSDTLQIDGHFTLKHEVITIMISIIALALLGIVYYRRKSPYIRRALIEKCSIEAQYRHFILNPTRKVGDVLIRGLMPLNKPLKLLIAAIVVALLATQNLFVMMALCILVLLIANRAARLKSIIFNIVIANLMIIAIVWASASPIAPKLAVYQLVTFASLLLGLALLFIPRNLGKTPVIKQNTLPWGHFYASVILFFLIGVPTTPSFVTELMLFLDLVTQSPFYLVLFSMIMLLLSLVVLHTLQTYFFNPSKIEHFNRPISPVVHLSSIVIIVFNLMVGIHPSLLFNLIQY